MREWENKFAKTSKNNFSLDRYQVCKVLDQEFFFSFKVLEKHLQKLRMNMHFVTFMKIKATP